MIVLSCWILFAIMGSLSGRVSYSCSQICLRASIFFNSYHCRESICDCRSICQRIDSIYNNGECICEPESRLRDPPSTLKSETHKFIPDKGWYSRFQLKTCSQLCNHNSPLKDVRGCLKAVSAENCSCQFALQHNDRICDLKGLTTQSEAPKVTKKTPVEFDITNISWPALLVPIIFCLAIILIGFKKLLGARKINNNALLEFHDAQETGGLISPPAGERKINNAVLESQETGVAQETGGLITAPAEEIDDTIK